MDIALLTGAYVNAGDFLIEQRAEELLKHIIKDVNIYKYKRNDIYKYINDINDMKVAIFCGGPIYLKKYGRIHYSSWGKKSIALGNMKK